MKSALRWLGSLFVAFSIGSVVSISILAGMLWWKGVIADERILAMLAALQGIKPTAPDQKTVVLDANLEQPSLDQIVQARLRGSLDLDLRESAVDKALGELRALEQQIRTESNRLDLWTTSFNEKLKILQTAATNAALLELQRTMEAIDPKQAKDQIIKMLEDPTTATDNPMHDVVTVMKAMPLDKRRKILAQFKTQPEIEKLAEIMRQIRVGAPDTELLEETQQELQQRPNAQP